MKITAEEGLVGWAGVTESPTHNNRDNGGHEECGRCGGRFGKYCIGIPYLLLCFSCAEVRAVYDPLIADAIHRAETRGLLDSPPAGG